MKCYVSFVILRSKSNHICLPLINGIENEYYLLAISKSK